MPRHKRANIRLNPGENVMNDAVTTPTTSNRAAYRRRRNTTDAALNANTKVHSHNTATAQR